MISMPLERSEAFILQTRPFAEQDKLVTFFSQDKGILKGIAKGAHKFGNRFGSALEPMSHVRIFYYEKEGRDLVTVSNSDLIESFFDLQSDLKVSFNLSYFSEIIQEFLPLRHQEDRVFRLLKSSLQALRSGGDIDCVGAYLEGWILKLSGFLPQFTHCLECRREVGEKSWMSATLDGVYCDRCSPRKKLEVPPNLLPFIRWIKKNPPSAGDTCPLAKDDIPAVRYILQNLLCFQLEREPKSLRYLK